MRKLKFVSVFLIASIMLTTTAFADFTDMPGDGRAKSAITSAVSNKILSGYEDGTVRPDNYITRAEMASIITRALGVTEVGDISDFFDVSPQKWYYPAIASAFYMGAFKGDGAFHMYPDNNITFQETFTILSQVFDLLPPYTRMLAAPDPLPENTIYTKSNLRLYDISAMAARPDAAGVADWAKIFMAGVIARGGCEGITIAPTEYITRAQFAIVMDNIIQNYIDEEGTYESFPQGNTVIRSDNVNLKNLSTDSDIIIADCVTQGTLSIKNVSAARLIIRGCASGTSSAKDSMFSPILLVDGTFKEIRLIRPYITADLVDATFDRVYQDPKASVIIERDPTADEVFNAQKAHEEANNAE